MLRQSLIAAVAGCPVNAAEQHLLLQVIAENEKGLLFKNKRDRKVINVDPKAVPGDNSTRTEVQTDEYIQAVIYDHVTRRKA